jgi:tellurite resistance protein TehA-like permease
MVTDSDGRQSRSAGRAAAAIRRFHPSSFAFVMATSIVSTSAFLLHPGWLSQALLIVASTGFVVLAVAFVIWLARYRSRVAAEIRAPERVFGFFAVSAACDLLGVRFASAGHPMVTTVLACVAATVWLVLTYGLPATLLLARQRESVLGGVDGTWLLWVVATQSLSTDASTLIPFWPSQSRLLSAAAVALWGVGLMLYLLLVALIMLRWLTVAMTPATLSPPYWILMGATMATVLAGANLLTLPGTLPAVRPIAGFIKGASFVFWSFGTWWVPLLLVLGLWRHILRDWPLTYQTALWTVVFPIGMYSVATWSFGKADNLSFMEPLARGVHWVAVVAWLLVGAGFIVDFARRRASAPHANALTSAA